MNKLRMYVLMCGVLLGTTLVSCEGQPFGQTLKTFFQDFLTQTVAAATT